MCQNRVATATVVDHVYPVAQGGAFVTADVQTLCHDHHSWKSAKERSGIIVDWRSGKEVRTKLEDYVTPASNVPTSQFRIL
jgi:hypothetical protein